MIATMTTGLTTIANAVDRINTAAGRAAAWLIVAIVLVEMAVILVRYVFGLGSIWLQESIIYAHAALFLLAAAWTLSVDRHVRVDVFYGHARPRTKAIIDLFGSLVLLLPFVIVLFVYALPYVGRSWALLERSREASGLPFVYLLKTLIPVFAVMLGLQGLAQAIRAWLVLTAPSATADHL